MALPLNNATNATTGVSNSHFASHMAARASRASNDPSALTTLSNLALLYENRGRYTEAWSLYRRALAGIEDAADRRADVLTLGHNLGELYRQVGLYDLAEARLTRAAGRVRHR